jgi:hypothetical protein
MCFPSTLLHLSNSIVYEVRICVFHQHCFICQIKSSMRFEYVFSSTLLHLSNSTVSQNAGIEPRTVGTLGSAVRRFNHSAQPHRQTRLDLIHALHTHMLDIIFFELSSMNYPYSPLKGFDERSSSFQLSSCAGIFFILPCIENYSKVDLRTSVIDIPPQEVNSTNILHMKKY